MKVRKDFVTNSSSSSFVIAFKELPDINHETLVKYPFLKHYKELIEEIIFADRYNGTEMGVVSKTKEEYDNNFVETYGFRGYETIESIIEDDDDLSERYKESIEYLERGYYILQKYIDYDDQGYIEIIKVLAKDEENFVVLRGEE